MQNKKRDRLEKNSPLEKAFKFDEADLNDNRAGFLSFRQKRQMQMRLALSTLGYLFLLIMAVVWAFLMFQVVILHFFDSKLEWGFKLFGGAVFLYCCASSVWLVYALIKLWRSFLADFREARVTHLSDPIQLTRIRRHKEADQVSMSIAGQKFELNSSQYDALKDKQRYRLYLAAQSQEILSIEAIEE